MTDQRRYYVVDRLEGDRAVLIADSESEPLELPLAALPFRLREAMVLAVPLDSHARPLWARAERDEQEERRRPDEGKARLKRLKNRDRGGNVDL